MIILRDFLEDFLVLKCKDIELRELLERLGVKVQKTSVLKDLFSGYTVHKINEVHDNYILDEHGNKLNSSELHFKLAPADIVIANDKAEIVSFTELNSIFPLFKPLNGKDILSRDLSSGLPISEVINLNYSYFESDNVEELFSSYFELARALHLKYNIPFLDKSSFILHSENLIFSEYCDKLQIKISKEVEIPKYLKLRLQVHGIEIQDLATAIKDYLWLEYGKCLSLSKDMFNGSIIYTYKIVADNLNSKNFTSDSVISESKLNELILMRILELWQQITKVEV